MSQATRSRTGDDALSQRNKVPDAQAIMVE
jgi:hypothetical protein